MLAIRMQRVGRKGLAQFRIVVQDSRQSPSSGRVVANLGTFNPHTKESKIDLEKVKTFVSNGAQPSPKVATLLTKAGVKLPSWVTTADPKQRTTRNAEKLRKNRPAQPAEEVVVAEEPQAPAEAPAEVAEAPAVAKEEPAEATPEEAPAKTE